MAKKVMIIKKSNFLKIDGLRSEVKPGQFQKEAHPADKDRRIADERNSSIPWVRQRLLARVPLLDVFLHQVAYKIFG